MIFGKKLILFTKDLEKSKEQVHMPKKNKKMKLAYLNFLPSEGQYKRMIGQANAVKSLGVDLQFIVLTDQKYPTDDQISIYRIKWPRFKIFKKIYKSFFRFRTILKTADLCRFDGIIMRYIGAWDLSFRPFLKKYKDKLVWEHHSLVAFELKTVERGWLNFLRIRLEQRHAPYLISNSAGIIAVTNEIRNKILELSSGKKPSVVISNGIDVEGVKFTRFQPFDGRVLNVIFVSSTFYSYQGLDRLLSGLSAYKGPVSIQLNLAGDVYRRLEFNMINRINRKSIKVHLLGKVYGAELDEYFQQATLAVSTLALHRKKMKQACSLKTREYLARGIPFIYAYEDMDLEQDCEFALKLVDNESPIDIQKVMDFTMKVSGKAELSARMRDYALKHVDWKNKMHQMIEFAKSSADYYR